MDLERKAKYTSEMYDEYILGSAQAVGLMRLQVFTAGNKEKYEHLKIPAMKLGLAFQKVIFRGTSRPITKHLTAHTFQMLI